MNQTPIPPSQASPIFAIISLALGLCGVIAIVPTFLFLLCAIFPIGFGLGAILVGILAKIRTSKDPTHYSGGGFAIGGIIAGVVAIIGPVIVFVLMILLRFAMY